MTQLVNHLKVLRHQLETWQFCDKWVVVYEIT